MCPLVQVGIFMRLEILVSNSSILQVLTLDMSDGVEHLKKFLDFIIVKVTLTLPETAHHHYIVCII